MKKFQKALDKDETFWYYNPCSAGLAHLVERHLAKVEVASSCLVARSIKRTSDWMSFFLAHINLRKFSKKRELFLKGFRQKTRK